MAVIGNQSRASGVIHSAGGKEQRNNRSSPEILPTTVCRRSICQQWLQCGADRSSLLSRDGVDVEEDNLAFNALTLVLRLVLAAWEQVRARSPRRVR